MDNFEYGFYNFAEYSTEVSLKGLNNWNLKHATNLKSLFQSYAMDGNHKDFGTLDIGRADIAYLFHDNKSMTATLNLYDTPINYDKMLYGTDLTTDESELIINYTSNVDIDAIMSTYAFNPHVKKGSLIEN
jgi:hypothetical protein